MYTVPTTAKRELSPILISPFVCDEAISRLTPGTYLAP